MKLTLTFKTPDVLAQAVDEFCAQANEYDDETHTTEEVEDELKERLGKWIEYGESVIIDFDLDADTATVRRMR